MEEKKEPTLEQLEESLKVFEAAGDMEMVYKLRGCIRRMKETAAAAAIKEPDCDACKDTGEVDGQGCPECCNHEFDPDEGFMCLSCGKEGAEDVMSAAYDRAKDIRKYGE